MGFDHKSKWLRLASHLVILGSYHIFSANLMMFTASIASVFAFACYNGWPYTRLSEMPNGGKMTCVVVIYALIVFMLTLSCTFHVQILRKRGKLGTNNAKLFAHKPSLHLDWLIDRQSYKHVGIIIYLGTMNNNFNMLIRLVDLLSCQLL